MSEEVYKTFKPEKKQTCKCPSCANEVPKESSCRMCGAAMTKRDRYTLSKLHALVIILGIVGLGVMWYGYYEANRITPIGSITASMEGQTVLIKGTVIDIEYDSRYEKTTFTVNDSTGSIDCYGWSDFTTSLQDADDLPSLGDDILVEGTVDVYNSSSRGLIVSLEIYDADSYQIIWNDYEKMDIDDILLNDLNEKVRIKGNVTDKYEDTEGSTVNYMFLDVVDETGSITVFISGDLFEIAGDRAVYPEENKTIRIIGWVQEYDNDLEIIPCNTTKGAIKIYKD